MALRFGLWLMVSVLVARACRWMTLTGSKGGFRSEPFGCQLPPCVSVSLSRAALLTGTEIAAPQQLQIMDGTNLQGSSLDQKKPPVRVRLLCRPMLRRNNFTSETELLVKTKQS